MEEKKDFENDYTGSIEKITPRDEECTIEKKSNYILYDVPGIVSGEGRISSLSAESTVSLSSNEHYLDYSWNQEFQDALESIKELDLNVKKKSSRTVNLNEFLEEINKEDDDIKEKIKKANERLKLKLHAYRKLMKLAQDFTDTSTVYGKIIISEKDLSNEKKTIKGINIGGMSGGEKFIVGGILFKFAIDKYGIFGGNTYNSQKVAANELRGLQYFFWSGIEIDLHFPLLCVIDYLGHRLIASSLLPIDETTIVYGCNNAGSIGALHSSDKNVAEKMNKVASSLNLKGHWIGRDGNKAFTKCPIDLEGHLSKVDNRYYVVDFARIFPPENPKKFPGSHLCNQLRPSLVMASKVPLCADAFTKFLCQDKDVRNEIEIHANEIQEIELKLKNVIIPRFAHSLSAGLLKILYVRRSILNSNNVVSVTSVKNILDEVELDRYDAAPIESLDIEVSIESECEGIVSTPPSTKNLDMLKKKGDRGSENSLLRKLSEIKSQDLKNIPTLFPKRKITSNKEVLRSNDDAITTALNDEIQTVIVMEDLISRLHRFGINVRLLGCVYENVEESDLQTRNILLLEMIARTMKVELANNFRISEEEEDGGFASVFSLPRLSKFKETIVSYLNLAISTTLEGDVFWAELLIALNKKFEQMNLKNIDIRKSINITILFRRLAKLTGIVLNEDALSDIRGLRILQEEYMTKPLWWREKNAFPSANFTFSDVEDILPKVKQMDVILHAEAQALSLEAMNKNGKEADRLFATSLNLLKRAFSSAPEIKDSKAASHLVTVSKLMVLWGDHLFERAKTTKPSVRSQLSPDWDIETLSASGQMYQRSFLRSSNDDSIISGVSFNKLKSIVSQMSAIDLAPIAKVTFQFTKFNDVNFRPFNEVLRDSCVSMTVRICSKILKNINLGDCSNITDKSLAAIAAHCINLEQISLWGLLVTDAGLLKVITSCKLIKHFDLCGCENLTNVTLKALSSHPNVKIIDVAGNFQMNFNGILSLAKIKSESLERISMGGLRGVSDESFNQLQKILKKTELSVLPQRAVPLDLRSHKKIEKM